MAIICSPIVGLESCEENSIRTHLTWESYYRQNIVIFSRRKKNLEYNTELSRYLFLVSDTIDYVWKDDYDILLISLFDT